jgi:hypothetical protein
LNAFFPVKVFTDDTSNGDNLVTNTTAPDVKSRQGVSSEDTQITDISLCFPLDQTSVLVKSSPEDESSVNNEVPVDCKIPLACSDGILSPIDLSSLVKEEEDVYLVGNHSLVVKTNLDTDASSENNNPVVSDDSLHHFHFEANQTSRAKDKRLVDEFSPDRDVLSGKNNRKISDDLLYCLDFQPHEECPSSPICAPEGNEQLSDTPNSTAFSIPPFSPSAGGSLISTVAPSTQTILAPTISSIEEFVCKKRKCCDVDSNNSRNQTVDRSMKRRLSEKYTVE